MQLDFPPPDLSNLSKKCRQSMLLYLRIPFLPGERFRVVFRDNSATSWSCLLSCDRSGNFCKSSASPSAASDKALAFVLNQRAGLVATNAVFKHSRVRHGNCSLKRIHSSPPPADDVIQTFCLSGRRRNTASSLKLRGFTP